MNSPPLAQPKADVAEISRALDLLTVPGGVVEIRGLKIPGRGKPYGAAGYFLDLDKAAEVAAALDNRKAGGVYLVLNEIEPALLARSPDLASDHLDPLTGDGDIIRRRWLPLDFDPKRPAGISADEAEHCAAEDTARNCAAWLSSMGWAAGILADSGNGAHLLYRIDLPNNETSAALVRDCIAAVADRFTGGGVDVDLKVFNAARIWKLYGTTARKGHDMPDRSHRVARLVNVPSTIAVVTQEQLAALAAMVTKPAPMPSTNSNGHGEPFTSRLDVPRWLTDRGQGFNVKDRPDRFGRTIYILDTCPFDLGHGGHGETAIYQAPDGKLGAECKHSSCTGNGWQQFKEAIGKPGPDHWNPPLRSHQGNGQAPADETTDQAAGDDKKDRFPLVTCEALDQADYTPCPIITDCLYAGHPAVDGGMFKTMKSLVAIDAAVSIASGRPFLNSFTIPEPMGVVYFSGEGGPSMIQEYGRRIADSKGLRLADVPNLNFCFSVPRLEDLRDLDAVKKIHDTTAAGVIFFDNLMLAMSGDDAGNVFKMGQIIGGMIRICNERGVTPVFIHHFKRTRATDDKYAPGELLDLTQAGPAEIAGQWWLLTRREAFDPDQPGEHRLWCNIGGRLGHGCLHALDIHEGRLSDPGGRRWEVEVLRPNEVRREANSREAEVKAQRASERAAATLDSDRAALVKIVAKLKAPETKTGIRGRAGFGNDRFNRAFFSLVEDTTIRPVELTKGKGKHEYEGWRLRNEGET